jgi:N-hydroxyarylamine O-acetyltransferase
VDSTWTWARSARCTISTCSCIPFENLDVLLRPPIVLELPLVDVGFGGVGSTAPLALNKTGEQPTPHEPRRLLPRNGKLVHELLGADAWADVYEFALEEPAPIDFELGNWFSCTHPKAHFRSKLVVTRAGAGCRFGLLNREFTIRQADGRVEKREITSPDGLFALLAGRFDLHFPAGTRFGSGDVPWPV